MKLAKRLLSLGLAAAMCMTGLSFPSIQAQEPPGENLALGKTVLVSSEEGTSSQGADTYRENAVDGNPSTCWTARTKDTAGNWDASYPEWLCVDLGAEYTISAIDLELESKGGQRIYDYKIYSSVDTAPVEGETQIPAGFELLADRTGNTVSGVQPTLELTEQTARYILVEILSCNQYSESAKWTAASIYELAVYGNKDDGDSGEVAEIPIQTASGRDEAYAQEIGGEWKFGGRLMSESAALAADYDSWQTVTIPHTWNAVDADDGGGNYDRTVYWYHKEFTVTQEMLDKRIYLEFLGVNTKADVFVNGQRAGDTHKGGYTTFRYDVTDLVQTGTNTLDVQVDNRVDQSIAPISGDFNIYGGIYKRVYLLAVEDVHVDLEDYGSSGLYLTTGNMRSQTRPDDLGQFNIRAGLVNDSAEEKTVTVTAAVTGDNAPAPIVREITIPAGETVTFDEDCTVENPTLWEGIDYSKGADNSNVGYQYTVTLTVSDGDTVLDKVSDKIGFRYFWIDTSADGDSGQGFMLNGEVYPLHGVNRHSFRAGVGSALTEEMHQEDMELMMEMGVNSVRLCHYPQTDYFYDLCDENGIVVWTEIPMVNIPGSASDFQQVTEQQLIELIRQQYNRPSVVFWGLENEIGNGNSLTDPLANSLVAKAKQLLYDLDQLAKEEDPTGRYTTQALNRDYGMDQNDPDSVSENFENNTGWSSDIVAWNIYPGWYPDANFYGTFEEVMDRKTALDSRPMGISEYGWGGNVNQHEADPELGKNDLSSGGSWHPEEYQNRMNEEAIAYINTHPEIWGVYYWAMFDFAVDSRNEGGQIALNDKGLVTADRSTKKDSFYLYKANWNQNDPFTYITSRRWDERDTAQTYIKVYSNCDEVELFVGGQSLGQMEPQGNGVFLLENVSLPSGDFEIRVVGHNDGDSASYSDSCTWNRSLSSRAEVESDVLGVDTGEHTIVLEGEMTLTEFRQAVTGVNNAVYEVYSGETEITDSAAVILPGMELRVTAEDGVTTAVYALVAANLCSGKSVEVSSFEEGNLPEYAVDGNSATRWTAVNSSYPQSITVDLEQTYRLGDLTLDWDGREGARYYRYYVEVSTDGEHFTEVIDRRKNIVSGSITESLNQVEGRYIRITATGCNQAGYATLYEIEVDGYNLTSDTYTIDHANHRIIVDEIPTGGLAEGTFSGNLNFEGNYTYRVNLSSGWIHEGNTVDILNGGQIEAVYTICTLETADQYPDLNINLALNRLAYASSEEGTATDGSTTTAEQAVDGDASTRWTAFINNGPNGEEAAYYPEWICVDLGGSVQLNRIDLAFESKGGRTYDYNVYTSVATAPPEGRGEIPDGFTLLYSRTNNTESGQQSTISASATARYILVEITGCSAYSEATPYVGASVYELEVYGIPTLHAVTVSSTSGGSVVSDADRVSGGTLVTLTAIPDQGYYLKEWRVLSGDVTIENGRFIMPDEDVVIQAVFAEGSSEMNIRGDLNRDGIVNVLDVMTLAQITVGKASPEEGISQDALDLNGDQSVNLLDVMYLAQIAAGRLQ